MAKLSKYKDFINEAFTSADMMETLYDAVKQLKKGSIITPLDYQNFDKEFFFEFSNAGDEYRIHYTRRDETILATNMDTGDNQQITSVGEFMNLIT